MENHHFSWDIKEGKKANCVIESWRICGLIDGSHMQGFFQEAILGWDPENQNDLVRISFWNSQEQAEPQSKYKLCCGQHPGANPEKPSSVANSKVSETMQILELSLRWE